MDIETRQDEMIERSAIPSWIRDYSHKNWTNVFKYLETEEHLYGTETLFGNWSSRVLLLAKDWGPTSELLRALKAGDLPAWRHAETGKGSRTNNRLKSLVTILGKEELLYGSATANMLYDDSRWSRSLPGFYSGPLNQFLQRVLLWVTESMPNLKCIGCLGAQSWFLTCLTMGNFVRASNFQEYRDMKQPFEGRIGGKKLHAFPLYHPAARVSTDSMERGWEAFATLLSKRR
jgi:hypothetical protein